MTDNNSNKHSTAQKTSASANSQASNENHQLQAASKNESQQINNDKPIKAAEPQTKMVRVAIADSSYNIFCGVHEEEELRSAVNYINDFALDIKKEAPKLSQEDLLVLCCLNLYEKISDNNKAGADRQVQNEQAEVFLNKIIKDAQSIL